MKFRNYPLVTILLLIRSTMSFSQSEAQNWLFGDGLHLRLINGDIVFDSTVSMIANEGTTSLSSESGDLLLYSNGEAVWNYKHEMIDSPEQLKGSNTARQSSLLLKHNPDNITLVTNGSQFSEENLGLNYHKIGNAPEYSIESANNLLHFNAAEGLAAVEIKECGTREYWVLSGKIDDPGKIYLYRASEDTVYLNDILNYGGEYPIKYIKFSPDSYKILVMEDSGIEIGSTAWLINFDPITGSISSSGKILEKRNVFLESAEFSSDSRFLYITLDQIYIYDAFSNQIISTFSASPRGMQLINFDRIIILLSGGLAFIDNINDPINSSLEIIELPASIRSKLRNGLPLFPASYFNKNLRADAGSDKVICSNEVVILGGSSTGDFFEWSPAIYLDNPFEQNPTLTYSNSSSSIDTLNYILEAVNRDLTSCDTVQVILYPRIDRSILGPKSVCPGEESIYRFNPVEGYFYNWQVVNGNHRQISEKEIAVQWSSEPGFGQIDLIASSINDICNDDTVSLSVQINVEIDTPIPVGPDSLCVDLENPVNFSTWYRPDATYIWNVENGNITSGQGESSVMVNWLDEGPYSIGLEEVIVTQDTICFGASPILEVNLIEDNSFIDLNLVTVDTSTDESILLSWESFNDLPNDNLIGIWRSVLGIDDFELLAEVSPTQNAYRDMDVSPENNAYSYHLSQNSWCNNLVTSLTHNSIHLQRSEINNQEIELLYNPYTAWLDEGYDVLILTKNISGEPYRVWDQAPSNSSPLVVEGLPVANEYYFRVGAKRDNALVSWSNEIGTDFNPPLNIPNVFTPNNDGTNDIFDFPNLEYYPENILKIFDRSGNEINTINNYEGKWDGAQLASGLYYYHFKELRNGLSYNGWFKILR